MSPQNFFQGQPHKKKASLAKATKKNKPKERFQFRRCGKGDHLPSEPTDFKDKMLKIYDFFEHVALLVLGVILESMEIDMNKLMAAYGDQDPLPEGKVSTSVFNIYHYYNTLEVKDTINCRQHIDPGLITVLSRGTISGLQISDPSYPQAEWIVIENYIAPNEVVVIAGETLKLVTGGRVKGCRHWVGKNTRSRVNMAFEMRPSYPIYWPWDSQNEKNERLKALEKKTRLS